MVVGALLHVGRVALRAVDRVWTSGVVVRAGLVGVPTAVADRVPTCVVGLGLVACGVVR